MVFILGSRAMKARYFDLLMQTIKQNQNESDIPIASLIIDPQGKVVSLGWNTDRSSWNIAAHAEINAINNLIKSLKTLNLAGYKLLTTLEPCQMCYSAIKHAKITQVEYVLDSVKYGITNHLAINDLDLKILKNSDSEQEAQCQAILADFFQKFR